MRMRFEERAHYRQKCLNRRLTNTPIYQNTTLGPETNCFGIMVRYEDTVATNLNLKESFVMLAHGKGLSLKQVQEYIKHTPDNSFDFESTCEEIYKLYNLSDDVEN